MSEPVNPGEGSREVEFDIVEAYRLHSEDGIRSLKRILERPFKGAKDDNRQMTIARVLDTLEDLDENYREIAREIAPEEEFPERGSRWPGLFRSAQ